MTIESGIALFIATAIFASIPGPGVSALVAQSLTRGFKTGAGFAAGLACGDLCYLLTALFGMGWVASQIGPWFALLKWAGAAYLVYLGVKAWMAKPPSEQNTASVSEPHTGRSFLAGLCVTLGNPKVIVFYCGFLPGFLHMPELTTTDIAMVVAIIIPTVFTVLATYAWLAAKGREAMRSTRTWKILNRTAGSIMIGAGAAIAAE
ncbi:LysE family translocator [Pseudodesulfovibrio sp. zrk46]|uniref:LysE family translocator n=1 Tax=Pseudodesulfovibrio sp. zrk46 TaxID=2725288 RepID=UPI001449B76B|nr:LysE family translocator [Pseudodesulfovibrio sp. zrk46]QJB55265.1 LysE family translocator [Pseudodesulfovibrio sp. zrk46]